MLKWSMQTIHTPCSTICMSLLTKALPFSVDTKNFITEATFEIFANLGN